MSNHEKFLEEQREIYTLKQRFEGQILCLVHRKTILGTEDIFLIAHAYTEQELMRQISVARKKGYLKENEPVFFE